MSIFDIKNYFLISRIGIIDINYSFLDFRIYFKNTKTEPHSPLPNNLYISEQL